MRSKSKDNVEDSSNFAGEIDFCLILKKVIGI
jgi:hypothetical protein